jgi:membrane-associated phospholipid phosphatase
MPGYFKNHVLILTGLLLIIQFNSKAQVQIDSSASRPPPVIKVNYRSISVVPDKAYFISYLTDARDIAISPVRWNKYQWIAFAGVTVGAVVFYTQDESVQKIVQKNQTPFWNSVSKYGLERLGSGLYSLPALGILYGVGALVKDDKARYTALKGVEAYVLGFLADNLIKQLTQRHRPYYDNPPNSTIWEGPFHLNLNTSFPSGHSTNIFAIATVIASAYNKTIWVPIVCYTLAGLTAASRVYQNDHWISDILVGSALGFAIGRTISNNHMKKLKILPISHVGSGVMLVYHLD